MKFVWLNYNNFSGCLEPFGELNLNSGTWVFQAFKEYGETGEFEIGGQFYDALYIKFVTVITEIEHTSPVNI